MWACRCWAAPAGPRQIGSNPKRSRCWSLMRVTSSGDGRARRRKPARRLEDLVGAAQLLQLLGGQPVIPLAAIGLVLADPVAQAFRVHAQLAGQVRDRPAGCSERDSRTARSCNSTGSCVVPPSKLPPLVPVDHVRKPPRKRGKLTEVTSEPLRQRLPTTLLLGARLVPGRWQPNGWLPTCSGSSSEGLEEVRLVR